MVSNGFSSCGAEGEALPDVGQPQPQDLLEPQRPGIMGFLPDGFNDGQEGRAIGFGPGPSRSGFWSFCRQGLGKPPDGVFAGDLAHPAQIVQDSALLGLGSLVVTLVAPFQIAQGELSSHRLSSLGWRQGYHIGGRTPTVTFINDKMIPSMVTLYVI